MHCKIHPILRQNPRLWNLFTRIEEYSSPIRDQYDRFPYYATNNKDIFSPVASQYLVNQGYKVDYPEGKTFAICLTHDIDVVHKSLSSKIIESASLFKSRKFTQFNRSLSSISSRKKPYTNFRQILNLEEQFEATSSFFFLVLNPDDHDYSYNIKNVEQEFGIIQDKGCEIGLHGGHDTYGSQEKIIEQKKKLEKVLGSKIYGYRNHFLRFRVPDTWEYLQNAGFQYDTTFGYADCAGFRNGMCHPFMPFNLNTDKIAEIIEIPLVIMDTSLNHYMELPPKKSWEFIQSLIDKVADVNGVLCILWHNSNLVEGSTGEKIYRHILEYGRKRNAWLASGHEIAEYYSKRTFL